MIKTNDQQSSFNLVVVTGPTASGKTAFAAHLATRLEGEIISADSRQVYRGMDLGTGKDYDDYRIGNKTIPAHLIDIVDPGSPYNVYAFQQDFIDVFAEITKRQKMPILCGGTGLYIEAVLKGYKLIEVPPDLEFRKSIEHKTDHELIEELRSMHDLHNRSDTDSRKRLVRAIEIARHYQKNPPQDLPYPKLNFRIFGIKFDRKIERERITQRLKQRLDTGLIAEVEELVKEYGAQNIEYFGLEYKFISWYISGQITFDEMFNKLNTAIHQFAKRQMTWFRRMEKNGFDIKWIDGNLPMDKKIEMAQSYLES